MERPARTFFLDALRRESAAFADAARSNAGRADVSVPGCLDWNLTDLILHLGGVQRHVGFRVRNRIYPFRRFTPDELAQMMALPAEYTAWLETEAPRDRSMPEELILWFEEGAERLVQALEEASPEEQVGTWFEPDQTAGFWQRRMAQEVAVHRWDAESVGGSTQPIESQLAADGVDEVLDVMLPADEARGNGESVHLHSTDGAGEWLLRLDPDGIAVTREHGKGDAAIRGPVSDLLLYLWGRPVEDRVEVIGDPTAVEALLAAFDRS
jgi:uncharacterized protein (TIGR03083 family)